MATELRLELLLGRRVVFRNGHPAGRLEEVRIEKRGDHYVVTEYLLGTAALLERLAVAVAPMLGRRRPRGYRVRWDQLDLSDPERPRLTCSAEELGRLA